MEFWHYRNEGVQFGWFIWLGINDWELSIQFAKWSFGVAAKGAK